MLNLESSRTQTLFQDGGSEEAIVVTLVVTKTSKENPKAVQPIGKIGSTQDEKPVLLKNTRDFRQQTLRGHDVFDDFEQQFHRRLPDQKWTTPRLSQADVPPFQMR